MARRRSLAGSLAAPLSGSLAGARAGGGSAPFVGVIDAMIAAGGRAPRHASSDTHRLYSEYTGPLLRAGLLDGSSQEDFGYGVDNRIDEAAFVTHFGASDGYRVTRYDQSGNGNDITQGTAARRVKIYDGATQSLVKDGSLPWGLFTGSLTNATSLERGDTAGISGAVAVSHAYFGARTTLDFLRVAMAVGTGANARFAGAMQATSGQPVNTVSGGGFRQFTPATATTEPALFIHALGAGAQVGTSTCTQDGTALSESSVTGPTSTATISGGYSIGSYVGGNNGFAGALPFTMSDDIGWSGGVLAAIVAFAAELEALT